MSGTRSRFARDLVLFGDRVIWSWHIMEEREAVIHYGTTEIGPAHFNADLYWLSGGFRVADPHFLVEMNGTTALFTHALELGRARRAARVDRVISYSAYPGLDECGAVLRYLRESGVGRVIVSETFPVRIAAELSRQCVLVARRSPLCRGRLRKSEQEVEAIIAVERALEVAVSDAVVAIARCAIQGDRVIDRDGRRMRSEDIRGMIESRLSSFGCVGIGTIVSSGLQTSDPHEQGFGPIAAHQPIVIDVFPVSVESHYFSDMTRTFFKGEPSKELQQMYRAVYDAQELALASVRAGVNGDTLYRMARGLFDERGYPTDTGDDPMGFFHGLGHGVGLEVHEFPRVGVGGGVLEPGNVVTVEPGLYYREPDRHIPAGGIRIEDVVLVTGDGCKNLTQFAKRLEEVILP